MTDQGAKVNTRALTLDFLLETVEKGGYSHVVMRGMLEKYQYLDKKERAFLTRGTGCDHQPLLQSSGKENETGDPKSSETVRVSVEIYGSDSRLRCLQ